MIMALSTVFHVLLLPILFFPLLALCFLVAICVYNLYFHPYASHPGPFWARVSPLYALWHAYHGDLHIDTLRCHRQYGPVVRYSPNRLIFNTTSGLKGSHWKSI